MKNGRRLYWIPIAAGAVIAVIAILQFGGSTTNQVRADATIDTETRLLAKRVPILEGRTAKLEIEQATIKTNVEYIKRDVGEIKQGQQDMNKKLDRLLSR